MQRHQKLEKYRWCAMLSRLYWFPCIYFANTSRGLSNISCPIGCLRALWSCDRGVKTMRQVILTPQAQLWHLTNSSAIVLYGLLKHWLGEQPLGQVSSMTFRSIFSIDPISVALKRNPGQFFKWDEQYILTAEISLHIFWDAKSIKTTPKGQWVLIPWSMFGLMLLNVIGGTMHVYVLRVIAMFRLFDLLLHSLFYALL